MPYATFGDVETVYERPIAETDVPRVAALVEYANVLLDTRVPSLAGRVEDEELSPVLARMAVVNAVLRVLRNPEGFKGEHGGEYGYYYGTEAAAGKITFSDDDLADLRPAAYRGRIRSVALDDDALEYPFRRPWSLVQGIATDASGTILSNPAQEADPDYWY